MEKGLFVKDIVPEKPVQGLFIIRRSETRKTRSGALFWSFLLVDATGEIEGKIWKPELCGMRTLPEEGGILDIESGTGSLFKNQKQISIEKARLVTDVETEALDQSWFRATSEQNTAEMWEALTGLCEEEFQEPVWHDFVFSVFEDFELTAAFCSCPGAISVHHAYLGGLLEHTLGVFTLCRQFADNYPELDRPLLLAGALFHDLGKIREYAYAVDISATDAGRLLGHPSMGVMLLEPFLEQSKLTETCKLQIKHLILSHHGELTFGACVEPMTQEAIALHFADNLDAKMAICRKQLAAHKGSGNWTEPIYALDGRRLFCPEDHGEHLARCVPAAPPRTAKANAPSETLNQAYAQSEEETPHTAQSDAHLFWERAPKTRSLPDNGEKTKTPSFQASPKPSPQSHQAEQAMPDTHPAKTPLAAHAFASESEAHEAGYEGFHFSDTASLESPPEEDLPQTLLAQWDEEDIAQGAPEGGEEENPGTLDARAYAGKVVPEAPQSLGLLPQHGESEGREPSTSFAHDPKSHVPAEEDGSAKKALLQETQVSDPMPQSGASALPSLHARDLASNEDSALQEISQERALEGVAKAASDHEDSISEAKESPSAAETTLISAFASDPELRFCDEELLKDYASESLPDMGELASLHAKLAESTAPKDQTPQAPDNESLAGSEESSFEEVSALAQTDTGFPREAGESWKASESSEDSEHSLSAQSASMPLQERDTPKSYKAPLTEMDRASLSMPKAPENGDLVQAREESTPSSQSVSKPLDQDEAKMRDPLEQESGATLENPVVSNVGDNQEHTALENRPHTPSSPLPAWAQDPPKKKRAGRKKKAAETPFALF